MHNDKSAEANSGVHSLAKHGVAIQLLPIALSVFVAFLTIGIALPVLPLHVHDTLHFSEVVIGIIVGGQFVVALLSRAWAGAFADTRGPKRAMVRGLLVSAVSGVVYWLSALMSAHAGASLAALLAGRVILGLGESLVITGALSWGIGLVGPQNAGRVMAWVGMAIWAAYAAGAPAGTLLYNRIGFVGVSAATLFIPLVSLLVILPVTGVRSSAARRVPFYKVARAVWLPGLGLAFSSVGFGTITAFISLLFAQREWGNASLAFTSFGAAFIFARLLFSGLPDRIGGARVALFSVLIEAAGQFLIWGSLGANFAYLGASLTGSGYSLAFPGFGVEAVRRAPSNSRGVAIGAYVAFMDLALGIAAPLLGLCARQLGVADVFIVGAGLVLLAFVVAVLLLLERPPENAAKLNVT